MIFHINNEYQCDGYSVHNPKNIYNILNKIFSNFLINKLDDII